MGVHHFPIRVYYEDTDAAGIVYYANYLKFAERARTEALRQCGFDQSVMLAEEQTGFVVRRVVVDFLKPAMLDDCLTIETRLNDISKVAILMHQAVMRGAETLVTMEVKLVVVGAGKKLAKLPEPIRKAMLQLFKP